MSEEKGRVSKIAGPVVDVAFPLDALPELNYALEVDAVSYTHLRAHET